jgi:cytochrome c5
MPNMRNLWPVGTILVLAGALAVAGCYSTPTDTSDYARGPAPLRMPSPAKEGEACDCYEDSLTGGQVFQMYCSYCHNVSLAERPFSNYRNVAAHMRVRANLTGKEYAKLMEFLRRWHDVPPPNAPVEPSPKRLIFSQPVNELRPEEKPAAKPAAPPQPAGGNQQPE